MMKRINIQSVLQAKDSLSAKDFTLFLQYYEIEIRDAEIEDLRNLAQALSNTNCNFRVLDRFYIGYKIPQIGKEFDLLRFGKESIINIELKNKSSEEKIKKQLMRNKYYLSFIKKKIYTFTFVSDSNSLYFLRDDEQLENIEIDHLIMLLKVQEIDDREVPDELFNPSDYLVSPFNSTSKFLAGKYFLTSQQEDIKKKVIDFLKPPKTEKFISIIGSAGTGKTLLTYDIAKHLIGNKRPPLIIHCGQLNDGQTQLIKNGWKICPIKNYEHQDLTNHDLVIVDEAQRIYPNQLEEIIKKIKKARCCCIFSHDKSQTLSTSEKKHNISSIIGSINLIEQFKLSEKIRTNKEIAVFIKMLFNKNNSSSILNNGNIQINYFNTSKSAINYLDALDANEWEILRFTPSQYNKEHHQKYSETSSSTSHQVIGQEFDSVAVTIDQFFSYDGNGDLVYKGGAYYDAQKMLFQNITRTRKKLNIIIIGNKELLNRCFSILQ